MEWIDSHRSFAVETYFETQESMSLTLKIFRNHFKLNGNVPHVHFSYKLFDFGFDLT